MLGSARLGRAVPCRAGLRPVMLTSNKDKYQDALHAVSRIHVWMIDVCNVVHACISVYVTCAMR